MKHRRRILWAALAQAILLGLSGCQEQKQSPEASIIPATSPASTPEIDPDIAALATDWLPEGAVIDAAFRNADGDAAFAFNSGQSLGTLSEWFAVRMEQQGFEVELSDREGGGGKLLQAQNQAGQQLLVAIETQGDTRRVAIILGKVKR